MPVRGVARLQHGDKMTDSESRILGLVGFHPSLLSSRSALGRCYGSAIGGCRIEMELPGLPEGWEHADSLLGLDLMAPSAAMDWRRGDAPLEWGRVCSIPSGRSDVSHALLKVDRAGEAVDSVAEAVYSGFRSWADSFSRDLALAKGSDGSSRTDLRLVHLSLELFAECRGCIDSLPRATPTFVIPFEGRDTSVSAAMMEDVTGGLSPARRVDLSVEILLRGWQAYRSRDYRAAVFEAAAATELWLKATLLKVLEARGVDFAEGLLRKFRTLGNLMQLARLIGLDLPHPGLERDLLSIRNAVVHDGLAPEGKDAAVALRLAESLVL